jgi:predicted nucleic acid-binding protein
MALIVVDAGVLIGVLDANDGHHLGARRALVEARARGDDLVLPATAYAEVMVGALVAGDAAAATVDEFIDALPARVEPVSREIARAAGRLRATHRTKLRLPDALVIATATVLKADRLLTTDARWPRVSVPATVVRPEP